ncbi:hypothetical protein GQR36_03270 [Enterococcus termitis]
MERLKQIFKRLTLISSIIIVGGCSMKEDTAQNYKNKNEAEKAVLNFLEKNTIKNSHLSVKANLNRLKI